MKCVYGRKEIFQWKKYIPAVVLIFLHCYMFRQHMNIQMELAGEIQPLCVGDYIADFYRGVFPFLGRTEGEPFNIPPVWSLYLIYFFAIIAYRYKCCVCPGIGIDICHLRNRCRGETYGNWRSAADGVEWIRPFGAEWIRTLERDDIHDGTGFAGAWRAAIRGVDEWKCASWNVCIGSSFGEFGVLDASAASGKLSDAS